MKSALAESVFGLSKSGRLYAADAALSFLSKLAKMNRKQNTLDTEYFWQTTESENVSV